jgi:hypothetical protein
LYGAKQTVNRNVANATPIPRKLPIPKKGKYQKCHGYNYTNVQVYLKKQLGAFQNVRLTPGGFDGILPLPLALAYEYNFLLVFYFSFLEVINIGFPK